MNRVPLFNMNLQRQAIRLEIERAVKEVLNSGQYVLGESVRRFEKEAAHFLGSRYAVGVASGTDAILLSLTALGVSRADEVITSPHTFFGTVGPVLHLGAKPVFVDIDPQTYNIAPQEIRKKISKKTKAILPVHLYGQCADIVAIKKISSEYGIPVVEDTAQAFGALREGKRAGTWGDLGAFSFYPTKNLGAYGDGGLICTNRRSLFERIRVLRVQGARRKYFHELAGYNSRLDSIQAAVLSVKLKYIDRWNEARREKAGFYQEKLKNIQQIILPYIAPKNVPIYHLYAIRAKKRDALAKSLAKQGVETGVYYPLPQHLQKALIGWGYQKGDFPEAERAAHETLTLPMFPELTRQQQERVIQSIREFYL
ncbi:MAG: DegT/DnrJ/EryC1/StrS family aminotransferase [Candidatus Omnitrophica bacterium]|nr:DegT/DnrJ/EryC1/StrS family aminotransferase [Candidatus Omnitrophota bacterium]